MAKRTKRKNRPLSQRKPPSFKTCDNCGLHTPFIAEHNDDPRGYKWWYCARCYPRAFADAARIEALAFRERDWLARATLWYRDFEINERTKARLQKQRNADD